MFSILFLIDTLFNLYLMVILLRVWLQLTRADFYNPFSQFVIKATHPIVGPMRKLIPSFSRIDTASVILAVMVTALKLVLVSLIDGYSQFPVMAIIIGALVLTIKQAFNLMVWVLIARAILSWVSQGHNPVEQVLIQLTEPLLAPIRRFLPPMGGLDLSTMVAVIVLIFIQLLIQYLTGIA
jgi:YggT family protein